MSKFLLLSDLHLSDKPPSSCTDSYQDDLLDLLGETVCVAEEHKADAVIWAGDIFHSKAPGRNSHRLVQKVLGVGKAYQRPWFIVPGNHDLHMDRLDSVWDTQPLGVLFRAGARALIGRSKEFPHLYGVPWQQEWSNETVGAALYDWRESAGVTSGGLVVTHAPLYPPGLELPYENYPAESWASAMGSRGSCFYGHVHEYHGTWKAAGVTFCNNGALSRGSLHEHNLTRQVMATIWDSTTCLFTEVPLHAKPASEVFRLREKQEVTDSAGKLDEFLAGIGGTKLEVLSVESVLAHVKGLDLGKDVEDEVEELLSWSVHQA
jgi:predicted phosphodiesterase